MPGTKSAYHPLMERLLRELQLRNIDLDQEARTAIQEEFAGRLSGSPDPNAVLDGWSRNFQNYVDLLDAIAGQRQLADWAVVVLNGQQVRGSFATCSRLCPGPA